MVSFSVDLDDLNWRLRVEAAPSVPRASMLRMEEGSGTDSALLTTVTLSKAGPQNPELSRLENVRVV